VPQAITHRIGQYQDLALTPDGESLYFIDKNSKELGRLEFATGVVDFIAVPMKWQSPSSLVWWNDQFVIADKSMSTIWLSKF
jgi:streptogramin lyase